MSADFTRLELTRLMVGRLPWVIYEASADAILYEL